MAIGKRLFDGKMYVEGLRQLRTFGILAFVVLELEAILVPLGFYVSLQQYAYPTAKQTLDFFNMHPLLVLSFTVFAPLMVLYLFHFLTKRNASDFYHSLPNTRTSLFLSFFAAVMTWVAAAAVISSATSVLCFSLLSEYYTIMWSSVGIMLLNMLAASLFTAASVAIAVCVSGTIFTNMVVSFLLIFLPRALLMVFTNYITSNINILSSHYLPFLVGMKYNVATNMVFGIFTGNVEESFTFWQGGVYTLCVGLIYTVIAVLLFRIRKSEAASQSAPNRFLQTGIRLLLGFVVCLYPCISITNQILGIYTPNGDDYFLYLVFYIMAVVVCIIYELITTKKWKSVMRIVPSLGILAVLNGVMIGILVGVYYSVLSFHPDAEDITHVELVQDRDSRSSDYYGMIMEETELYDPQILSLVANRLKNETDYIRNRYYTNNPARSDMQMFAIHTKNQTVYRRLPLTTQEEKTIAKYLAENPTTRRLYQTLPSPDAVSVFTNQNDLTSEQNMTLYTTICQEVEEMDFTEWYAYLKVYTRNTQYFGNGGFVVIKDTKSFYPDSLNVRCTVKGQSTYLNLPLIDLFPKTANLYMEYVNGQKQNRVLEVLASKRYSYLSLSITASKLQDDMGRTVRDIYFDVSDLYRQQEELQEFLDILTPLSGTPADIRKPLLALQVTYEENYVQYREMLYVNYPEDTPLPDLLLNSGVMATPTEKHAFAYE